MKYKVTFFLKEPTAERETPINAHFYFQSKRLKIATGQMIHPKHWDAEKQRAKRGARLQTIINDRLDEYDLAIVTAYEELRRSRTPITPETLRDRLAAKHDIGEAPANTAKNVLEVLDLIIQEMGSQRSERTLIEYRIARKHLEEFASAYSISLSFDRIDTIFFEKFAGYLVRVKQQSNETVWKIIRNIRAMLRRAVDRGFSTSEEFKKFTRRNIPRGESSKPVYLTPEELEAIRTLDLSNEPELAEVRDLFIFQAHTGMRWQDITRVSPEHIQQGSIEIVTQKNRKAITIPFHPIAREIWDRYEGQLPRLPNWKQNEGIKEVARKAKITASQIIVRYSGVERKETIKPKCEMIGTHTAKRSFVTILRRLDVSVEAIMAITGNNRQTIEAYILVTEEDAASEVRQAWQRSLAPVTAEQETA